ncbi:Cthe_2314 family HEPN domain-containing protein [Pseudomonas putida]|uniref:Cthe_2314 family HEPN domain-containing protein n=1 Tax=Pseudomonas putida TaxID=303 RepID=UPI00345D39F1
MHVIDEIIILDKESPLFSELNKGNKLNITINTELAAYIFSCSKALSAISSCIDKARLSLSFLDIKHLEFIASNERPKGDYIELLVENTIIRAQSIYDRTLIFTNRLLDLGISNESINHNHLVTNEKIKAYGLDAKLKSINKACKEYREVRNTVIHHDRYSEEDLDRLSVVMKADHLSRQHSGEPFVEARILTEFTDAYLTIKREDFNNYLEKIEAQVYSLYDAAIPIYTHYKDKMRTPDI